MKMTTSCALFLLTAAMGLAGCGHAPALNVAAQLDPVVRFLASASVR